MDIVFGNTKLRKDSTDTRRACKKWGARRAKLVRRRLDELSAADNLEVMRTLPQARCHELKGNRAGQLSVDLEHPYRLLFSPAHDPVPRKDDGGLDWKRVTAVEILEVTDTHG